jgi:hypothetical protein
MVSLYVVYSYFIVSDGDMRAANIAGSVRKVIVVATTPTTATSHHAQHIAAGTLLSI